MQNKSVSEESAEELPEGLPEGLSEGSSEGLPEDTTNENIVNITNNQKLMGIIIVLAIAYLGHKTSIKSIKYFLYAILLYLFPQLSGLNNKLFG